MQLKAIARPAPFVLKPFAGLYNPYPYGCSILCNHPTDIEAKELLRKAKDHWVRENFENKVMNTILLFESPLSEMFSVT